LERKGKIRKERKDKKGKIRKERKGCKT